jgi:putative molybdopterin biosynthesis protein
LARGYSQGDLARVAGVTRQAISGIESGRWSPSLLVGLSLARALDTSVEELFGEASEPPSVSARLALRTSRRRDTLARRVLLSDVGGDTIAFPLSRDRSFLPGFVPALGMVRESDEDGEAGEDDRAEPLEASRALTSGKPRRHDQSSVRATRIAGSEPTLAIAGCDPALALLQGPLARHRPPLELVWWQCGNTMAEAFLEGGAIHAAAVHRGVGTPSQPRPDVAAVGFASWREGLALAPRHRGKVKNLQDVVSRGLRIANRERGSEARRLLDDQLDRLGIASSELDGYETACSAHLLVASAIGSGLADAAVTTEPAALAFGLAFIPWQEEICELHIPRALMGSTEVRALLDVLGGRELPRQLATLEGYNAEPLGRILVA